MWYHMIIQRMSRTRGIITREREAVLAIRYNTINITYPVVFPKTTVPWLVSVHHNHTWYADVHATA